MKTLFIYLIFPGFLFTAAAGMMASWLDRKLTARIQWRVGPPWYQPFADIVKLFCKETVVPLGCSRATFFLAPLAGLAGAALVASILGAVNIDPHRGFVGDLIVIIYLLILPSLALLLGGAASRNPLASLGVSREMKLMIAYEFPFILAVFTPVIKGGLAISLGGLLLRQQAEGNFLWHWSCILSFAAAVLCMQAKLGYTPFDIAEAETEINAGPLIEYSGSLLAVFKLTRMMLLVVVPVFLLMLFAGGSAFRSWGIIGSVLQYLALLILIVVIKNTNPRLRIDQALRFFWGPVTALAAAGAALALLGC